jgi:hypothetical protein
MKVYPAQDNDQKTIFQNYSRYVINIKVLCLKGTFPRSRLVNGTKQVNQVSKLHYNLYNFYYKSKHCAYKSVKKRD